MKGKLSREKAKADRKSRRLIKGTQSFSARTAQKDADAAKRKEASQAARLVWALRAAPRGATVGEAKNVSPKAAYANQPAKRGR